MASLYVWTTRSIPAFTLLALALLLILSFVVEPFGSKGEDGRHHGDATVPQLILSVYCVFCHIMSIVFPVRVCWAIRDLLRRIRKAVMEQPRHFEAEKQEIATEKGTVQQPLPLFIVILPAYKEEVATLEETLRVMASHRQAHSSYHVYLAMEEKEENSAFKAASLVKTFEKSFYRMSYTVHPSNIPGEAQGKSSNEAWAAKQAMKDYPEQALKRDTIMTVMDADTHLSSRYFAQIARLHLEHPDTNETTIYVPPLVFDRNLHHVPLPVRTADLMWAGAGISSLYYGSSVCIPTSVYSLPMGLVEHVGGWDTDPGAIGEDMHKYHMCFFALSGNLNVQIVYAAASQCNVSSGETGLVGYLTGLQARYKQALRHMWGSLDTGFSIRQTASMFKRHRQLSQVQKDLPLSAPNSNWTAFYTSTGLHKSLIPDLADKEHAPPTPIHWWNLYILYHRLFEAHFLPQHLATILISSAIYTAICPSFLIPPIFRWALDVSSVCRLIGWCTMLCYFYFYERYHKLCVGLRQEEMREAGMLEQMVENDGFTLNVFQYFGLFEAGTFPIGGVIFGALPAVQAVLSHLLTDRLTYVVSLKPSLPSIRPWKDLSSVTP